MKMYYFKSEIATNFGDELNVWLWPKLLPSAFDGDDQSLFLGIGSILFDHFPSHQKKVVFGAGYGGYSPKPIIDGSWQFYFVRGQLTARALGLDPQLGIGDSAILIRSCETPVSTTRFRCSFIPHWESLLRGNWAEVCRQSGIHLIDPRLPVEAVLAEISGSELVITEAMHGAIVADALRIPWIAIEPNLAVHRMKWYDWASALNMQPKFSKLGPSNGFEWVRRIPRSKDWVRRFETYAKFLKNFDEPFVSIAADRLTKIARGEGSLSCDGTIRNAHERMLEKLDYFKRDNRPREV